MPRHSRKYAGAVVDRHQPRRRLLVISVLPLLLAAAFSLGWFASPERGSSVDANIRPGEQESAAARAVAAGESGSSEPFATATDAALAAALEEQPDLAAPTISRIIGIFADETTVDLRIQVSGDAFCGWYGVIGTAVDNQIEWRTGRANDTGTVCRD